MSEPFIGEIKQVGYSYAPPNWAECNGQGIPISENQALFVLLGTAFGGDGRTTFSLPNFNGRAPVHEGLFNDDLSYVRGMKGGTDTVTLTQAEMPIHTHALNSVQEEGNSPLLFSPATGAGNIMAISSDDEPYYGGFSPSNAQALAPDTISGVGGNAAHYNIQPSLCVLFIISLAGIFPSRN